MAYRSEVKIRKSDILMDIHDEKGQEERCWHAVALRLVRIRLHWSTWEGRIGIYEFAFVGVEQATIECRPSY